MGSYSGASDATKEIFDFYCKTEGFAIRDIETQSLPELKRSLRKLEDFLVGYPDGLRFPSEYADDPYNSLTLLRLLLHRESYITARIAELSQREQMDEFKDAIEQKVEDPSLRQELSGLLSEIEGRQEEVSREARSRAEVEINTEMRRVELQERKWNMRKSLLDREPAAVLIGAVLLGLITLTLIFATFTHTQMPDIFANAFLLILGYFFGQTTSSRERSSSREKKQ
ncbi:hypothetical protein [Nocardia sp. NPDC051570]|uniref:hypothetical protein n=1 Tax=Nocardia sp. NPDC051570 TaxID=3364324 RepID=UPI0037B74631